MTRIEADPALPIIRISREFQATPARLHRAHTDPERLARWTGPDRLVQTFTYEGDPDGVALQTLWFDDLGNGRARLRTQSLVEDFATRDGWLRSGMETGVQDGYRKLERMLTDDTV